MSKIIWIDTTSGTWGEVDGDQGRLLLVEVDEHAINYLSEANDQQIAEFGDKHGSLPSTVPNPDWLADVIDRADDAIGNTDSREGDAYQQGVRDLARFLCGFAPAIDRLGIGDLGSALEGLDCGRKV